MRRGLLVLSGAIGFVLFVLGAVVITGWHLDLMGLVRVRPGFPPMQYATAMAFLLGGLGLLACVGGYRKVSAVCGGLILLFGGAFVVEVFLGRPLAVNAWVEAVPFIPHGHPGRPAPLTSITWSLGGCLLLLLGAHEAPKRLRSPVLWMGGMAILFLCLMKLMSYFVGFIGAYAWGDYVGMAFHTSVGLALFAVGLLAAEVAFDAEGSLLDSRWLPLVVGGASALAVVLVGEGLRIDQYHQMEEKARLVAETLRHQVLTRVATRLQEIDRMAHR
ncbi:MAG TPA: hypothetical protein VIM58_05825 [Candidatus Methylacidiphilales bacterium]